MRELNQVGILLVTPSSNFEAFIAEIGNGWLMLVPIPVNAAQPDMGRLQIASPKYGIKFLN